MDEYKNEKIAYYTIKAWQWDVKKKKAKDFVRSIPRKAKEVWDNDKELVLFLAPGVVYTVRRLVKMKDGRKEDHHRNCQVFDHSLGMWHDLRRPMTAKEKALFAERKAKGESTLSILTALGLLKR